MEFKLGYLILAYFALITIVAFALMGIDKHKAKKHLWRIPEKTLFLTSLLGGSVGTLAGMYLFHHKTRHWYFRWGFPLLLALQAAGLVWLALRFGPWPLF